MLHANQVMSLQDRIPDMFIPMVLLNNIALNWNTFSKLPSQLDESFFAKIIAKLVWLNIS